MERRPKATRGRRTESPQLDAPALHPLSSTADAADL